MAPNDRPRALLVRRDRRGRRRLTGAGLIALGGSAVAAVAARGRARSLVKGLIRRAGKSEHTIERAVTINRPVGEVFSFWRDFTNLPHFMAHLERVDVLDERRSHWVAKSSLAGTLEWDAEMVREEPDRLIAWRAVDAASVPNEGTVSFAPAPGDRGAEVRVSATYRAPAGALGVRVAQIAGDDPDQQVREELRRLKQVLECGRIIEADERVSARSPRARRVSRVIRRRLATGARP